MNKIFSRHNKRLSTMVLSIAAMIIMIILFLTASAYAEDKAVPRKTIYYVSYTDDGAMVNYTNSGSLLSGGTASGLTVDLDEPNPQLYVNNDVGQVYTSLDPEIAVIEETFVEQGSTTVKARLKFIKAGTVTFKVEIPETADYQAGEFYWTITIKDTSSSTAQSTKSTTLKRPTLKCTKRTKRANKLTWSKVSNAKGYILYVKYPGKSKYVKVLTKKSTIKSVTHKGLTSGKKYSYKVRAYTKVNGKTYYSPYSKAITVKVK